MCRPAVWLHIFTFRGTLYQGDLGSWIIDCFVREAFKYTFWLSYLPSCKYHLQACFSFVFLFMPALVINTTILCKYDHLCIFYCQLFLVRVDASSLSPILSCLMAFGTLFNPFVDITLTPDYQRRFAINMLNINGLIASCVGARNIMVHTARKIFALLIKSVIVFQNNAQTVLRKSNGASKE